MLRRLINLIYAGWVPNELVSSWSCLYLETGVSAFQPIPKPSSRILQTVTAPLAIYWKVVLLCEIISLVILSAASNQVGCGNHGSRGVLTARMGPFLLLVGAVRTPLRVMCTRQIRRMTSGGHWYFLDNSPRKGSEFSGNCHLGKIMGFAFSR